MKYLDENDREVDILDTEFERGEGVYVMDAVYIDNGEHVSEETLQYLTDAYQMDLYEDAEADACAAAYDMYKDSYKYGE